MKNFYRLLKRFRSYCTWENLNPLNWNNSEIKMFLGAFFAIMLPIYIFIGLQPVPTADAASLPKLEIASIGLSTPVETVTLTDRQLIAPDKIAGVYTSAEHKIFILGHSSTVFKKLHQVQVGDTFAYDNVSYRITTIQTLPKSDIDMNEILQAEDRDTIIIMTCAGDPLPNQDATHRLIITALREEA